MGHRLGCQIDIWREGNCAQERAVPWPEGDGSLRQSSIVSSGSSALRCAMHEAWDIEAEGDDSG